MQQPKQGSINGPSVPIPRRVLVGLGANTDEAHAIEAALALAQALKTEVSGHFVEDSNLLNFAELPFTTIFRPSDRTILPIERSQMQQEISNAASNWQRVLRARAEQSSVTFSFHESQGEYCSEISKVVATTDIVILNPSNMPDRWSTAVATALAATREALGAVILPEKPHVASGHRPIVLLFTDTVPDEEALRLTGRISAVMNAGLSVITTASQPAAFGEVLAAIRQAFGTDVSVHKLSDHDLADVAFAVSKLAPSFVIWPRSRQFNENSEAATIIQAAKAPVLLLRQSQ